MSILSGVLGECIEEMSDVRWIARTHGRRATYNAGCRGAMCTKVERDARRALRQERSGPELDTRTRQEQARDKLLEAVQFEHDKDRLKEPA